MRIVGKGSVSGLVICASLIVCGAAAAAPPANCAGKFVGVWRHHGMGGITNKATLTADGTAACSENSACVQGTWTCEGNVLKYNNGMYLTDYTLRADGVMTARGGITVTRIGRGPPTSKPSENSAGKLANAPQEEGLNETGISARGTPFVKLRREVVLTLTSLAKSNLGSWIARKEEDIALKEQLVELKAAMDQAVKDGRWNEVQRNYPKLVRLVAQVKALRRAEK